MWDDYFAIYYLTSLLGKAPNDASRSVGSCVTVPAQAHWGAPLNPNYKQWRCPWGAPARTNIFVLEVS